MFSLFKNSIKKVPKFYFANTPSSIGHPVWRTRKSKDNVNEYLENSSYPYEGSHYTLGVPDIEINEI